MSSATVIEDIIARKIFNNRGEETIEIDVITTQGFGRAAAPSGKSRGKTEVAYYPQGGVDQAVKKVEDSIAEDIVGCNADNQEEIDRTLHEIDGTKDFRNIGGNAAYALSLANAEAAADSYNAMLFQFLGGQTSNELPYPLGNTISGGTHTAGKSPDIQEFLGLPLGAETFFDAMEANVEIHKKAGEILQKKDKLFSKGRSDEGAWVANVGSQDAFEIMAKSCEDTATELGFECHFGIDVAASSLWNGKRKTYLYERDRKKRNAGEQLDYVLEMIKTYHLAYVEDPFQEDDFESFAEITRKSKDCLICGDDLFTTNVERLKRGIAVHAGNAVIIKVNQIGTLTDAIETVDLAHRSGYSPVISHRSGDTCDWHIAHLAVALRCPLIKSGIVEGARIAKMNELIRIEEFLGDRARMARLKQM